MEKRTRQINVRFTEEELADIQKRAIDRKQKISELLRDLLRFGMLPEIESRR